jgi:hypothetical protein
LKKRDELELHQTCTDYCLLEKTKALFSFRQNTGRNRSEGLREFSEKEKKKIFGTFLLGEIVLCVYHLRKDIF